MEIIGYILVVTVINYGIWLLFDDFSDGIKGKLKNATTCEVLFILLVIGVGLMTNWE